MNILIQGYLDRNFGDDLMIRVAAYQLEKHKLYLLCNKKELLIPFKNCKNIYTDCEGVKFDAVLGVIGAGFQIKSKTALIYALKDTFKPFERYPYKAVIGCNIEPFYNKTAEKLIKRRIRSYNFISARDEESYGFFRKAAPKSAVCIYPDILFGLPEQWCVKEDKPDGLGISVIRRIGRSDNFAYYEKMARLSDMYIEKSGKKVRLFAFNTESENDIAAAVTIKSLCKNKDNIEIICHDDDGTNIISNFGRCEKIIAARFHSIVLALRMGILCIPLIYAEKSRNLLKDLNFKTKMFDINAFSAEDVFSAVCEDFKPFDISEKLINGARLHTQMFEGDYYKTVGNNTGF